MRRKWILGIGLIWLAGAVAALAGQVEALQWPPEWGTPVTLQNINLTQQTAEFKVAGRQWIAYAVKAMWDKQVPVEARRIQVELMGPLGARDRVQIENNSPQPQFAYLSSVLAECVPSPTVTKCYFRVTVLPSAWWVAHPKVPRPSAEVVVDSHYAPDDMVFIPGGTFQMGDAMGDPWAENYPVHAVQLDSIFMAETEVTGELWDRVGGWAGAHGYDLDRRPYPDSWDWLCQQYSLAFPKYVMAKGAEHPVVNLLWYDAVKWCNARSEMEGLEPVYYLDAGWNQVYRAGEIYLPSTWVKWNANGYRLPTEAEWEYAARGGLAGRRFAWAVNTISHAQANYYSEWADGPSQDYFNPDYDWWRLPDWYWEGLETATSPRDAYDVSPTPGFHPDLYRGEENFPLTFPVGYFAPNGYGLYDMVGNVGEWCWDVYDFNYYNISPINNPRGPEPDPVHLQFPQEIPRVIRGGDYFALAEACRVARRNYERIFSADLFTGFRPVRRP